MEAVTSKCTLQGAPQKLVEQLSFDLVTAQLCIDVAKWIATKQPATSGSKGRYFLFAVNADSNQTIRRGLNGRFSTA